MVAALSVGEAHATQSCANTDWRALGYQDGDARGTTADAHSYLVERMADCEEGDVVDASAYNVGFLEGLSAFCQPPRAFRLARSGGVYEGFCPVELSEAFATAYADGLRVRSVEQMAINAQRLQREERWNEREQRDRVAELRTEQARNLTPRTALTDPSLSDLLFANERRDWGYAIGVAEAVGGRSERRADAERARGAALQADLEALRAEFGDRYGEW